MPWNGFSLNLTKKLINAFTPNPKGSNNIPHVDLRECATPDDLPKIWIRLPFLCRYGNILTKKFINKTHRLLKSLCKFILNWQTTNSNCFLSCKDKTKGPQINLQDFSETNYERIFRYFPTTLIISLCMVAHHYHGFLQKFIILHCN